MLFIRLKFIDFVNYYISWELIFLRLYSNGNHNCGCYLTSRSLISFTSHALYTAFGQPFEDLRDPVDELD